MIFQETPAT